MSFTLLALLVILALSKDCDGFERNCILLSLPAIDSYPSNWNVTSSDGEESTAEVIAVSSESEHAMLVEYVSATVEAEDVLLQMDCAASNSITCCSSVAGIVGDIDAKTASIALRLSKKLAQNITLVSIVAPSTFLPLSEAVHLPNVFHLKPLSHYIGSIVSFLRHQRWTRIGVIADDTSYFQFAAERLLSTGLNKTAFPYIRIMRGEGKFARILREIKEYRTHVFVMLMREPLVCSLLRELKVNGLTWPEYAWIVLDIESECNVMPCIHDVEGVFVFKERYGRENTTLSRQCYSGPYNASRNSMPFLNHALLYSAFSIVQAAIDSDSDAIPHNLRLKGGKRLYNISIINSRREVAFFDPEAESLVPLSPTILTNGSNAYPNGNTEVMKIVKLSLTTIVIVAVMSPICFVYVTTVFFLYVCFHKEPEIRATSVSVSLCMFLGSYLLLALIPVLLAGESSLLCNLQVWLSGIGLSILLIFATLFVKLLRVYIIFSKPKSFRRRLLSNPALLLYILLILLPQFLILVLWCTLDTFTKVKVEHERDHLIKFNTMCHSEFSSIWVLLLTFYLLIVILAVVILAFKSSAIRYKNFQDTKATNAFTFLAVFITISTLCYWLFFRKLSLEQSFSGFENSVRALCISHTLLAFLCPTFLFVPKLRCLFRRHRRQSTIRSKPPMTTT